MNPTPTKNNLPLRQGDFTNLAEALDYAAAGITGYNFYDGTGKLSTVLPYKKLRKEARSLARRLLGLGPRRGARVALVADTQPDFMRYFFACQYAGLVPIPLPAPIQLGDRRSYVAQLRKLLVTCKAEIAIATEPHLPFLMKAAASLDLSFYGGTKAFVHLPEEDVQLHQSGADDLAYLQFTSGSTRFPRGVMINQKTVMNNLTNLIGGVIQFQNDDRAVSWLPFYHDMGLVGMVLAPLAAQVSVDYLNPRDFAMRPRLWLKLMSDNRATISFGSAMGYELCQRRLRPGDIASLDLSPWRVAGIGAETIRPEPLIQFADNLAPAGFKKSAFVAGYGMAECSLAVSFSRPGRGLMIDHIDPEPISVFRKAMPVETSPDKEKCGIKSFVNCGEPLPGFEVQVRDEQGRVLPERQVGTLYVRGPSVMNGYYGDVAGTREVLSNNGWLNTGDLAYRIAKDIVITGRAKDHIFVNGRNVWPQDLEALAEQQPEVRIGDALAISVPGTDGNTTAVLLIQCRKPEETERSDLVKRLGRLIQRKLFIDCTIELVPRHTLPRTTSGKLSRSQARKDYLNRIAGRQTIQVDRMNRRIAEKRVA
jgi:fatty-acyl-CoA synthase